VSDLIAQILERLDRLERKPDLADAVATGDNTVTVGNSTVPVALPAIISVASGDFCQVLTVRGGNRVILGPTGKTVALTESDTYEPTLTNIALGTGGTRSGKYVKIGPLVMFEVAITFSTSGTVTPTGNVEVGLPPFDNDGGVGGTRRGEAWLNLPGVGTSKLDMPFGTTNTTFLLVGTASTYAGYPSFVNATQPSGAAWPADSTLTVASWYLTNA
jgi:hypothetical protein